MLLKRLRDQEYPLLRIRYDALKLGKMEKTPEGYLRGDAVVTRAGVFRYMRADGALKRELRHPLDVFDSRSLDTLKLMPMTNGHPKRLLSATDVKEHSVGATGENYRIEDGKVVLSLCVQDAKAVAAVEAGKNQLSLGYEAEVEDGPGHFDGQEYDTRQRSIRYNHLAIVESARAGPEARIRLDSGSAIQTDDEQEFTMPQDDLLKGLKLVAVRLDGIEYQASPEVARAMEKATTTIADQAAKLDKAATDLAAANKATETEKGRADGLKQKLDEADKNLPQRIKERGNLLERARKILGDALKVEDSDEDIVKAAVTKACPELKLDGKSPEYVRARFDAAVEEAGEEAPIDTQRRQAGGAGGGKPEQKMDATSARERMVARLKQGGKEPTKDKE